MDNKKFSSYTTEDLKIMQGWDLRRKIQVTQTRIMEWYDKFDGQVYVSFSGGKDSTVLLDLTRRVYPDVEAVFVDTGLEYPELREFVKTVDNVTWVKPEMNFKQVIKTHGYPLISKTVSRAVRDVRKLGKTCYAASCFGYTESCYGKVQTGLYDYSKWKFLIDAPFDMSEKCCNIMKKKPLKSYQKKTKKYPIVGTMAYESISRRNAWLKNGCNAFDAKEPKSQPMSFWTEQDVLEYISRFGLNYASVYGEIEQDENGRYYTTGCDRTGCVFCGFGCHLEKEPNRFQRLKKTHPKLWDYCMRSTDKGGLGMQEVLDYIGVKTE